MDSSSTKLCSFSNNLPSSNCAKFIMLPVCSWEDLAYGMYETVGCVDIAFEYGCDVYDNNLEDVLSNTTPCEEIFFHVLGMYKRHPFVVVGFQQKYSKNILWLVTHV